MKKKQRTKRKDGLKRQSQIMSVALALFAEKGYNASSVDEIIKKSGIAKDVSAGTAMFIEYYMAAPRPSFYRRAQWLSLDTLRGTTVKY